MSDCRQGPRRIDALIRMGGVTLELSCATWVLVRERTGSYRMTTLPRQFGFGEKRGRRLWPIVLIVAAAVLAIAPLYLEVLVMHARLAAAEQSVEKIVGRMGRGK